MKVSTPGRICLFGEHQDYLNLPVIAMAISLRSTIDGQRRRDRNIIIHKSDIGESEHFSLDNLDYLNSRDYFKSGIKICQSQGLEFSQGFDCEIKSDIPIQAGVGSSSAILVSWIHFLSQMADNPKDWSLQKMGKLSYQAEVKEFNEPGGMMDQYCSAMGNLIFINTVPKLNIESINSKLGTFVLGDSNTPKNTISILKKCKNSRVNILKKIKSQIPEFDLQYFNAGDFSLNLNADETMLFEGTIRNRDLLNDALGRIKNDKLDHNYLGKLLNNHHKILRDVLKISTPKIETMIDASINAGALGGKITGSGGGGCMFAYAPNNPEIVAKAIEEVGGKAYIIQSDVGTKIV